jgi:hypothetical protein
VRCVKSASAQQIYGGRASGSLSHGGQEQDLFLFVSSQSVSKLNSPQRLELHTVVNELELL